MTRQDRRSRQAAFDQSCWNRRHAGEVLRAARLAMVRRASIVLFALFVFAAGFTVLAADPAPADMRKQANTAQQKGNFKDAYETYQKLLDDAGADKALVSRDLVNAVQCLQRLGREDEIDKLVEKAIKTHAENWKLLETAAQQYQNLNHQGTIVAGEFYRGHRRSNDGKHVFSFERDRIRALEARALL